MLKVVKLVAASGGSMVQRRRIYAGIVEKSPDPDLYRDIQAEAPSVHQ